MAQEKDITYAIELLACGYEYPFNFSSEAEYTKHNRKTNPVTLKGETVKSLEEVQVANWLHCHNIKYKYERLYPHETATRDRRQYIPDFYLPEYDVYIEHFALGRWGKPPVQWSGYQEGVDWKRKLHQTHGTTMLETTSWISEMVPWNQS